MNELARAIDELFRAFANYSIGDDFVGCEHCVDSIASKRLATTDLVNLSLEDLDSYSFKAISTWGNVSHFKHFIPRLFELAAIDPEGFLSVEVLFGKLNYGYGRWYDWPTSERIALESYFSAFWRSQLSTDIVFESRNADSIDTCLCALGCANDSVKSFLRNWLEAPDRAAVRQLSQFIWLNADAILRKDRLWNAHWTNRAVVREVIDWLASAEVREYLQTNRESLDAHLLYAPSQLDAIRAMCTFANN